MLIFFSFFFRFDAYSQTGSSLIGLENITDDLIHSFNAKVNHIEDNLNKRSVRLLNKLRKQELKMKRKLARKDTAVAEELFGNIEQRYQQLQAKFNAPLPIAERNGEYLPHFDTLKTSLEFLSSDINLSLNVPALADKGKEAMNNLRGLEDKLAQAADIKKYLKERRGQLKENLNKFGLLNEVKKYNKQTYYYGEQIQEYRAMLNDPARREQKAIELIKKIPAFQDFFKKNSMLAGLFQLPDNYASVESLAGLQTRSDVEALLQGRIAAGGPNSMAVFQNNVKEAQNQLSQLKDKLNQLGDAGDADMPDFKPNNQKTKTFLQRLEYGTNLQSQRSSNFFPTTSDIGLSVGYKLNSAGIIGIGVSYKVGWGRDIRNISISSQGVGLRSFADYKIKGSFFASGGFEYNYQQPFSALNQVRDLDTWQQSGLLGISKIISMQSNVFKKTRLQLFWDFLSYQQRPQAQAIKFRVGYNF